MRRTAEIFLIILGCTLPAAATWAAPRSSSPLGALVGGGAGLDGAAEAKPSEDSMSRPMLALPAAPSGDDKGQTPFPALHAMSLANSQIRSIPIYRYPEQRARVMEQIAQINPANAMATLREIIQTDPDYAPAYAVLAIVAERFQPGNEESQALLETASDLAPDNEVVRAALLEFDALRGQARRCIEGCQAFLLEAENAGEPIPVWPYELIANAAVREEDPDVLLTAIDSLIGLDHDNIVAVLSLASYVRITNNYDPAIARYEAIVRTSRDPIARNNLAYLYTTTGRHRQALTILEQLAGEYPDSVAVRDSLALAHLRLGETDQALVILDGVISDAPRFAPALLHRALVYADQGRIDEARDELRRAVLFDAGGTLEEAELREARRKIP